MEIKNEQAGKEKPENAKSNSDISQQLKTPPANILLNTELLKEGKLSRRDQRQFLMRNQEQAAKMQGLMKK